MFRLFILIPFVVFASFFTYGQAEPFNQFDVDGKKKGWWITYLNDNLEVLKDSSNATHYMYNFYINDNYTYRFGEGYGSEKHPMHFPENDTSKLGKYVLLDGKYSTIYKDGSIRSELIASSGVLISFKKYYPNGELKFEIIYSTECGAPKRHCLKEYKKDGSLKFEGFTWVPKQSD